MPSWREAIPPSVADSSTLFGGIGDFRGSGAIHFNARYNLQEMIRDLNLVDTYETFVIVRSDSYYTVPFVLTDLDTDFVWVHKGQDYGGVVKS